MLQVGSESAAWRVIQPFSSDWDRPAPLPVRVEGIPESLRAERRWVVWAYEWRKEEWTKPPRIATAPEQHANSTDAATWRSFPDALAAYEDGKCDGIGFVLGDEWVGFDADGTDASDYVQMLNTYTECSPSGKGVHAIARGTKPGPRSRNGPYELYDRGRYFTVTGHHVVGTPTTVEERTAEIATVYARLFPPKDAPTNSQPANTLPDDTLIAKASAAPKSGPKFAKLWTGDFTDYDSHSEADLALCAMLAFWTNRDAQKMDRLFRRSGLMRAKWDDRRGDSTYGADLIAKTIAETTKGYTGSITLIKASDVPDERLEMVFGGRLLRGSFPLLAGPGDVGKGMFLASTLACFTTGEPFPGETTKRNPMDVLCCVTEDSMGRVKSRLRAAGADLERVHFVQGPEVQRGGLTMPSSMMLDDDAGALVQEAKAHHAGALFLETVVEHFGDRSGKSRRSTHTDADVRSALAPFRTVCQLGGLYGLGAIHPRKNLDGGVEDSISGSAAFRNVPRGTLHIYRDPEDETDDPVRLLFSSKANYLNRRPRTLRFRIVSWNEDYGMPCNCHRENCGHEGRVEWLTPLMDDRMAEEIWRQIADRGKPRRDVAVLEAENFLKGLMEDGRIALKPVDIFTMADAEGITKAAVKRAKEKLKLISEKDGFPAVVVGWRGVSR